MTQAIKMQIIEEITLNLLQIDADNIKVKMFQNHARIQFTKGSYKWFLEYRFDGRAMFYVPGEAPGKPDSPYVAATGESHCESVEEAFRAFGFFNPTTGRKHAYTRSIDLSALNLERWYSERLAISNMERPASAAEPWMSKMCELIYKQNWAWATSIRADYTAVWSYYCRRHS